MKKTRKTLLKTLFTGILSLMFCLTPLTAVFADGQFTVSPMNQKIVLTPGETYEGSFKVGNPSTNKTNFAYKAEVAPFYVTEDYEPIYENNGEEDPNERFNETMKKIKEKELKPKNY